MTTMTMAGEDEKHNNEFTFCNEEGRKEKAEIHVTCCRFYLSPPKYNNSEYINQIRWFYVFSSSLPKTTFAHPPCPSGHIMYGFSHIFMLYSYVRAFAKIFFLLLLLFVFLSLSYLFDTQQSKGLRILVCDK